MSIDVADLVKRAAEAAKHAPEHLQEAAFNRAFEALEAARAGTEKLKKTPPGKTTGREQSQPTSTEDRERLLGSLDRTAHPEIGHENSTLENSLRLLRAVKQDLGIDGLSATEVASILVNKFRSSVSRRNVSRALNDAGRYVNRHKEGKQVIFRIMAPGEEYLDRGGTSDGDKNEKERPSPAKATRTKRRAGSGKQGPKAKPAKKSGTKGGGPTADMTLLFENDFFEEPRTIGDIIEKLKHDRGRTFKAHQISPVLLRWLRSERVTRTRNADGQYEYTAK